jgi:dCTP diphosphatase
MALAGEAGELLEIFQWLSPDESELGSLSPEQLAEVSEEIADIVLYTLRLCDKLQIDVNAALEQKIELNSRKYPVSLAKGNAIKYNKRDPDSGR